MTPQERVNAIMDSDQWHHTDYEVLGELIATAIQEAVQAERERCAKVVAYTYDQNDYFAKVALGAAARRILNDEL